MRRPALVAACVLLASWLVSCADETTSSGTESVSTPIVESTAAETTRTRATSVPGPATTEPPPPPSDSSTPAPTTNGESDAAPCTADAIMPVVAGLFPENESWNIVGVDIRECRNGYARVFAIPDQSICDPEFPNCLEEEQVFLEDVDGSWVYLDAGTGIDCRIPADLSAEMVAACEALGLT